MDILHSVLHTFPYCADKENLLKKSRASSVYIISFTLMNLMFDPGVFLLLGEIRC